ncbi:hypothetical protein AO240_18170 [Pseudomonas sp. ICMP 460]|nr:hypothetical protein AO240_18170 [Pseudomonas sp. ICMP 460]
MTIEELNTEFAELLDGLALQIISNKYFIKLLSDLSERQWHTYRVLNVCTKGRIYNCLMSAWNGYDLELIENVVSVMVRLGLERINIF